MATKLKSTLKKSDTEVKDGSLKRVALNNKTPVKANKPLSWEELTKFKNFVEVNLPYEARCKENWMDPSMAGTGAVNDGECDIMWVTQGEFYEEDFDTLLDTFGRYYRKATHGKTYSVVMKSRNFPGHSPYFPSRSAYMKRKVKFNNGRWKEI